jgi:hypothetical protein
MFASSEHEEEGTKDFVSEGDEGALVSAAEGEGSEFRLKDGACATGGIGEFTE